MLRDIRIEISPVSVCMRIASRDAYRDDACVALRIRKDHPAPEVVALGREAAELPDRAGEVRVDASAASFWRVGEGMRCSPPRAEELEALGEHDGLVAVVWPLSSETFAPETASLMLNHMLAAAIGCSTRDLPRRLQFARIEVCLEGGLDDDPRRDDIIRALWAWWRHCVVQGGRRVVLRHPPSLSQMIRSDWYNFAFGPLCVAVMVAVPLYFLGAVPLDRYTLGMALFYGVGLVAALHVAYQQAYFRKLR